MPTPALVPFALSPFAVSFALGLVWWTAACDVDPRPAGGPDRASVTVAAPSCPVEIPAELPPKLSGTGLFLDVTTGELSPCARPFEPRFWLWTDGAEKRRYVYLPDGAVIDDADADAWQLPAGARLWKEFSVVDGSGALSRVETRVLWRTGEGMLAGAYVWDDDGADATLRLDGVTDVRGAAHDVPDQTACTVCHGDGAAMRPLGFQAVQLSRADETGGAPRAGLRYDDLVAEGRIQARPEPSLPGDALDKQVLGWLHVNCGSCHREGGSMQDDPLRLALAVSARTLEDTAVIRTAVGQIAAASPLEDVQTLITAGDPDASLVFHRASARDGDGGLQMPPLGTERVDPEGMAALRAWIVRLAAAARP